MHRQLVLTLVAAATLALTSCTVAVKDTEPPPGPRISPARAGFMLQCWDNDKKPLTFRNLEEAWERSNPELLDSCRSINAAGTGIVTFSAEDLQAIEYSQAMRGISGYTDEMRYRKLIELCATWDPVRQLRAAAGKDVLDIYRGILTVCPDAPFAEDLDDAVDANVTIGSAKS